MNVDRILDTLNRYQVAYLVIGGMNFLLRHKPVLTYDLDLWIEDAEQNLRRCESALSELSAQWGPSESDWKPVAQREPGWLSLQPLFCLTSPHGALDIFRFVRGMDDWRAAQQRALSEKTATGIVYRGISDEDMLRCQQALDPEDRNQDRIQTLEAAIQGKQQHADDSETT